MATGCLVVGSATPPVAEVIEDEHNGLLFDFFSPDEMAERVLEALDYRQRTEEIRRAARQTIVDRYELQNCLRQQIGLIESAVDSAHARCF
jgi:glycosyltransferase involved in cell wall biosynthesis